MALYTKADREVIRKKLIRWRKLTELSEQQAAVICNVTLEEYQKLETGEIQIDGSVLDKAALFSEMNSVYFYREKSYEDFESTLIKKLEKRKKRLLVGV